MTHVFRYCQSISFITTHCRDRSKRFSTSLPDRLLQEGIYTILDIYKPLIHKCIPPLHHPQWGTVVRTSPFQKSMTKCSKVITNYSTWYLTNLGEKLKWSWSTRLLYPFYLWKIAPTLHYAHCAPSQGHPSLIASGPGHSFPLSGIKHSPFFMESFSFSFQRTPCSCSLATRTKTHPH